MPTSVDPKLTFTAVASLLALIVAAVTLSQLASNNPTNEGVVAANNDALPPLFPLEMHDYIGFLVAIVGLMMAAGGGIGGGGILVPVYILILQFPVKYAISLASITVFGGAVANMILNLPKRHPDHPTRSCIDWDLILLMEPMAMAGALLGTVFNKLLPELVIVVLLLLLLSLTAYTTLSKAAALYKKETIQAERKAAKTANETQTLIPSSTDNAYGSTPGSGDHLELGQQESMGGEQAVNHQALIDALKLTGLVVIITILELLKGGPESASSEAISYGNATFWLSQATILLVIVLFSLWVRTSLLHRIKSGGPVASDIIWDESNTIWYPLMAVVAGLVAGMFGIGGGIVKGPLLLALGVHPAVTSATSACMILFTSSTATISYGIFGLLVFDYAIACLLVGFIATLVGQTAMALAMQRYQRHSYIAFLIGIVVAVSAVCMAVESIFAMVG